MNQMVFKLLPLLFAILVLASALPVAHGKSRLVQLEWVTRATGLFLSVLVYIWGRGMVHLSGLPQKEQWQVVAGIGPPIEWSLVDAMIVVLMAGFFLLSSYQTLQKWLIPNFILDIEQEHYEENKNTKATLTLLISPSQAGIG